MKILRYNDKDYSLEEGETVLDCLLRHSHNIPYSCKAGVCQSCMMKADEGALPTHAQLGLKPSLQAQKLFLACQCYPEENLTVKNLTDCGLKITAKIIDITPFTDQIQRLRLTTDGLFKCQAGQYITLVNLEGTARSYSIANIPDTDGFIELHIKRIKNGRMSNWLKTKAKIGDQLSIAGPAGHCFYTKTANPSYPILLAGTSTGLAPLYGILQDALAKKHLGSITLIHGALTPQGLYLVGELEKLAQNHSQFTYIPCVLNGAGCDEPDRSKLKIGDIGDVILSHLHSHPDQLRLFLCGAADFVNDMKVKAFIEGVFSQHIYADAFLPSQ